MDLTRFKKGGTRMICSGELSWSSLSFWSLFRIEVMKMVKMVRFNTKKRRKVGVKKLAKEIHMVVLRRRF